ncbi:glycosyl hydrolase [Streptomyces sp. NPDC048208]|uniref:glycosyl hydrolase n=1 Tax=Streptomyces sp. NPDC048208 TaxID=3365515 RepID=UPI003717134E
MNDDLDSPFDFGLAELAPADDASEEARERFWWTGDLTVLSQHHTTPNGSHSFVLAHDQSATWGIPGAPQLVAIAVARDLSRSTFTFETSRHATASFAENWLIERGCPPEHITLAAAGRLKPNDDLTVQVEQQIRESGTRYEVLDTHAWDSDPCETWTVTRDARAAEAPVRVFHEEWSDETGTYTMREGAFTDVDAAHSWLDDRGGPLPEPPEYSDHNGAVVRARMARISLARSAEAAATLKAARDAPRTPPAAQLQRPVQGRLL